MTTPAAKTLVVYLVCEPETPTLAEAAVEGGADLVELGFPFSDPLAEGPVIQRASERALAEGMRTRQCLECLAEVRARVDVPLVPMTYAAILEAYGYERFDTDARAAGATSAIVVDLPVEEHPEVRRVQLVAPTSTDDRIAAAAARDRRLALPRLRHRHDRRAGRGFGLAAATGRAYARRHRRAALRRLRDRDARAGAGVADLTDGASSAPASCRWPRRGRPRCAPTSRRCARRSTPSRGGRSRAGRRSRPARSPPRLHRSARAPTLPRRP